MAIKLNSVKCPECGASLPIEEGRTQIFCSYCGTKVVITNENEYVYRHIDEARVKHAETDRIVRLRELDMEEKNSLASSRLKKVLTIIWLVLSLIIVAISIIKIVFQDDFLNGIITLFYLGFPIIGGGGALIFKVIPEKENEKELLSRGGIKLPKSVKPFTDKNYETVYDAFKKAGFLNIRCVNLHDVTSKRLRKSGSTSGNLSVT